MPRSTLWHFPISHYNEKARWALDFKEIPHTRRALFLGYLPMALWKTGRATLPILIQDNQAIGDSSRIIAALEQQQPDPPLYPASDADRSRALELEDFFDEEFGHAVRAFLLTPMLDVDPDASLAALGLGQTERAIRFARMGFPAFRAFYKLRHKINKRSPEAWRQKVIEGLDRIDAERRPSGYLVGDHFTVADLTAAALASPLVWPPEFPYAVPVSLKKSSESKRDSLSQHAAFGWVREMYRRHRGKSCETGA